MNHDEQHCDRIHKVLGGEFASQEVHDGRYDERTDKNASADSHGSRPDEKERCDPFYRCEREQMKIVMCRYRMNQRQHTFDGEDQAEGNVQRHERSDYGEVDHVWPPRGVMVASGRQPPALVRP